MSKSLEPSLSDEEAYWAWKKSGSDEDAQRLNRVLLKYARTIVWEFFHGERADLATNIVTQAFMREGTFRGEAKFTTWFYRLAHNACLTYYRKEKNRRECSLQVIPEPMAAPLDHSDLLLANLLEGLQQQERLLLNLKVQGLSGREIASRMGLKVQQVKDLWKKLRKQFLRHRGRGLLRTRL